MGNIDTSIVPQNLMAGIDFDARIGPLFDFDGNMIDRDIGRRVYRHDTDETLAVCGPGFAPVQHRDVVEPILSALVNDGYSIQLRQPDRRSLHDLAGRKGAFLSHSTAKNGAIMRSEIILGDFIQPTGSGSYLSDGPDTNFFRISVLNSHDGSYAARVNTSYLRLICMNGMTQPNFSANFYGRHTKNFSVDAMVRQIENAMGAMSEDADRFGQMARTKLTPKQAEQMLIMTVARLPNKPNGDPHHSAPLVKKILTQFQREDQTAWGLMNAITWWQTHSEIRVNANPVTTTIAREKQVAAMQKHPAWLEALDAC